MKISEIKNALNLIEENKNLRSVKDFRMISATKAVDENQKEFTVFSSNNYLGLTHEKSVIEAGKSALAFGSGSTGSRLTSGSSFELSLLEKNLADFKGCEDALVFNTGYMTNLGVLYALADKKSVIFSDALNHASIIDGCRISGAKVIVYKHNDMKDLEKLLSGLGIPDDFQIFVVSDGVFSMDGDIVNLPALLELKAKYNFCLIIDDAHALGVIGEKGLGTAEYYGLDGKSCGIDIQIGTLSKALAAEGGYAASSKLICDYLRNKSRPFIFSTALPPSVAASANEALNLLKTNGKSLVEKLNFNTRLMRNLLEEAGLPLVKGPTPIIPIVLGETEKALLFSSECLKNGILLSAIRPPSVPAGTSRIRLTVTAAHSEKEIRDCAKIISELWRKL